MNSTTGRRRPLRHNAWALGLAALLALVILAIHVKDQGGFPGDKDPGYIKVLYFVLEAACLLTGALLLSHRTRVLGWLLAAGVAAGPIIGYVLTRGPGLPDAMDDKGNWGEPLGVVSLVVEGVLLVLALAALASSRRRSIDDGVYGATEPAASTRATRRSATDEIRSRR